MPVTVEPDPELLAHGLHGLILDVVVPLALDVVEPVQRGADGGRAGLVAQLGLVGLVRPQAEPLD